MTASHIFNAGFIGLGAMGTPMVEQLAAGGQSVLIYDLDESKSEALGELQGVSVARALGELREVPVVVCMLPDSNAVEAVVTSPGGLLDVLPAGALILDMGSSDPSRTIRLAKRCGDRGVALVDAPVSGGVAAARRGSLTVMLGGTLDQLAALRGLLGCIGDRIVHVGDVGAGHALKALNNVMSAVNLSIACEVLEVGHRFGLDPEVMLDVINHSTGRNQATETKLRQFVLSEAYSSGFLFRLMLKDLQTAGGLARAVDGRTPLTDACLELWESAAALLSGDADQTEIIRAFRSATEDETDRLYRPKC